MIRRFNYTGHKKIPASCAYIQLFTQPNEVSQFQAQIDLSGQNFPSHAKVYVEAYYRSSMMRFPFGEVRDVMNYSSVRYSLDEIQNSIAFFRVKIVDESDGFGRIIGAIDRIRSVQSEQSEAMQSSLLAFQFADLGDLVWRVDVDNDHGQPILQVNDQLQVSDLHGMVLSDLFTSLVFPAAIQQVMSYMLFQPDVETPEEGDDHWSIDWLRFATSLQNLPFSLDWFQEEYADKQQFIEDTVRAFCLQHNFRTKFEQGWSNE